MISSTTNTPIYKCFLCIFVLSFFIHCCLSKDNITTGEAITGPIYLESPTKKFQMGLFSLENESIERYVGVWYTMDPKTVVWVANRDNPLPDSSGVLTIAEDGELKVLDDKDQKRYFSTTTGRQDQTG
ncbi:putative non-specific serine/threonine protein kinase [Helianthus anomalus]